MGMKSKALSQMSTLTPEAIVIFFKIAPLLIIVSKKYNYEKNHLHCSFLSFYHFL